MLPPLRRWLNARATPSGETARERLRHVLVQDHAQLSPLQLERLRAEILEVVARYCAIDANGRIDLDLTSRDGEVALEARIPVERAG